MNEDELKTAEFNRITDRYFREGVVSSYDYESLTPLQRDCIQWAKRAFNRITRKDDKETDQGAISTESTKKPDERVWEI